MLFQQNILLTHPFCIILEKSQKSLSEVSHLRTAALLSHKQKCALGWTGTGDILEDSLKHHFLKLYLSSGVVFGRYIEAIIPDMRVISSRYGSFWCIHKGSYCTKNNLQRKPLLRMIYCLTPHQLKNLMLTFPPSDLLKCLKNLENSFVFYFKPPACYWEK